MGYKKREVVVLVAFLMVSVNIAVAGWQGHCSAEKCVSIMMGIDDECPCCDPQGGPCGFPGFSCDVGARSCQSFDPGHSPLQILNTDDEECIVSSPYNSPPSNGCWVLGGEEDGSPSDDECAAAKAPRGSTWGRGNSLGKGNLLDITILFDDYYDAGYGMESMYTDSNWEYLCADDNLWNRCVTDSDVGKVTWANNFLYKCSKKGYYYEWEILGEDKDRDSYGTLEEDCADDPSLTSAEECSEIIDSNELIGLSVDEIRTEISKACKYPQHSKCALCINPAAPEVCGGCKMVKILR
ncbi:MAG: hypothetical protein AB1668_06160 [Nanoarchaeota archaeon]